MNTPQRIQRTRKKGQGYRFPAGKENNLPIAYVGRPTQWGNPFKVGDATIETPKEAVLAFQNSLTDDFMAKVRDMLRGKNLACWCKLGEACHADILLKIANE